MQICRYNEIGKYLTRVKRKNGKLKDGFSGRLMKGSSLRTLILNTYIKIIAYLNEISRLGTIILGKPAKLSSSFAVGHDSITESNKISACTLSALLLWFQKGKVYL